MKRERAQRDRSLAFWGKRRVEGHLTNSSRSLLSQLRTPHNVLPTRQYEIAVHSIQSLRLSPRILELVVAGFDSTTIEHTACPHFRRAISLAGPPGRPASVNPHFRQLIPGYQRKCARKSHFHVRNE